MFCCA
jgi:myotubularin-related protein 1/2